MGEAWGEAWGQTEFQVNLKLGLTPRRRRVECRVEGQTEAKPCSPA